MTALLETVGSVVTNAVGWVGSFAGTFLQTTEEGALANPILIVPLALALAGFGVGILKRLMSVS